MVGNTNEHEDRDDEEFLRHEKFWCAAMKDMLLCSNLRYHGVSQISASLYGRLAFH